MKKTNITISNISNLTELTLLVTGFSFNDVVTKTVLFKQTCRANQQPNIKNRNPIKNIINVMKSKSRPQLSLFNNAIKNIAIKGRPNKVYGAYHSLPSLIKKNTNINIVNTINNSSSMHPHLLYF